MPFAALGNTGATQLLTLLTWSALLPLHCGLPRRCRSVPGSEAPLLCRGSAACGDEGYAGLAAGPW